MIKINVVDLVSVHLIHLSRHHLLHSDICFYGLWNKGCLLIDFGVYIGQYSELKTLTVLIVSWQVTCWLCLGRQVGEKLRTVCTMF